MLKPLTEIFIDPFSLDFDAVSESDIRAFAQYWELSGALVFAKSKAYEKELKSKFDKITDPNRKVLWTALFKRMNDDLLFRSEAGLTDASGKPRPKKLREVCDIVLSHRGDRNDEFDKNFGPHEINDLQYSGIRSLPLSDSVTTSLKASKKRFHHGTDVDDVFSETIDPFLKYSSNVRIIDRYCGVTLAKRAGGGLEVGLESLVRRTLQQSTGATFEILCASDENYGQRAVNNAVTRLFDSYTGSSSVVTYICDSATFGSHFHDRFVFVGPKILQFGNGVEIFTGSRVRGIHSFSLSGAGSSIQQAVLALQAVSRRTVII